MLEKPVKNVLITKLGATQCCDNAQYTAKSDAENNSPPPPPGNNCQKTSHTTDKHFSTPKSNENGNFPL